MPMNQEPQPYWNVDDLIYAEIRYLDPDPRSANEQDAHDQNKDNLFVICVCSSVALLVLLAIWWFYWT